MGRNYAVLHYIKNQCQNMQYDDSVCQLISRAFNRMDAIKDHNGCLSNSVALFIGLTELGLAPQLCYGLCKTKTGMEFYHAWIELDEKVIDIAVYGNLNYSPYLTNKPQVELPIVFENYADCYLNYGKFHFDEDWSSSSIAKAESWTISQYVKRSPQKGMYTVLAKLLDEYVISKIETVVSHYEDITISYYKDAWQEAQKKC